MCIRDSLYLYRAITVYGYFFQSILVHCSSNVVVLQPQYCRNNTGLGCSNFARRYYRNHFCFLFLRVLRCFSSPGLPPCGYYIFNIVGCPIRKSSDQRVCAPPRSLSQLITSFIASWYQGIHRILLVAWPHLFKGACYLHETRKLISLKYALRCIHLNDRYISNFIFAWWSAQKRSSHF